MVLLEAVALTGLIGAVPPLRALWYLTALLLVALGVFVWLLLSMGPQDSRTDHWSGLETLSPANPGPTVRRAAASHPVYPGLEAFGDDPPPIVVKRVDALGAAGG